MNIKVGVDLVYVPKFEKLLADEGFMNKVFHSSESEDNRPEHLAGVFAAKEAFYKTLGIGPGWHDVEVKKDGNGRPCLIVSSEVMGKFNLGSVDVSISHEKDYAMAVVMVEKED